MNTATMARMATQKPVKSVSVTVLLFVLLAVYGQAVAPRGYKSPMLDFRLGQAHLGALQEAGIFRIEGRLDGTQCQAFVFFRSSGRDKHAVFDCPAGGAAPIVKVHGDRIHYVGDPRPFADSLPPAKVTALHAEVSSALLTGALAAVRSQAPAADSHEVAMH